MKWFAFVILLVIAINAVVLPNAQQELLAVALVFGGVLSLSYRQKISLPTLTFFMVSWIITLTYTIVGLMRGATSVAVTQTVIIYIISPLLWILVIDLAWRIVGADRIVRVFGILAIFAAFSVGLYIYLYLNVGPQAVGFFGPNANVNLTEGYSAIIMHVSGSLIFLGAAFVAEPDVIRSRGARFFVLICIALAAMASGRTMAISGLVVGSLVLLTSNPRLIPKRSILWIPYFFIIGFTVSFGMDLLLGVDVLQLIYRHFEKFTPGGDVERPAQIAALLNGAEATWFLGAGHGIGVDYIRSTDFPWRYEAVFVALIYKLGIVGALVVLFPILYALTMFIFRLLSNSMRQYDAFFGSALIACTAAGITNPYPEAFSFQWMYLLPTYHFLVSRTNAAAVVDKLKPVRSIL